MRITLLVFILMLVTELAGSQEEDYYSLKKVLERNARYSGGKTRIYQWFYYPMYDDPVPVLEDSVFATVKEYPEGYTGYLCSVIGNLRYTFEHCSNHVWECSNGKLFKKTCAESLVFWFSEGTCEPTCKSNKKNVLEEDWPLAYVHVAQVKNATEFSSLEPGSAPVLITADCRNYSYAHIAIKECHPEYIVCTSGYLSVIPCASPGWVFDERSLACGPKESCRAPVPHIQYDMSNFNKRFDGTPDHEKVMRRIRFPGSILLKMDCNLKRDGDFEHDKCHPNYVQCRFGRRTLRTCYDGQVFKYGRGFDNGCIEMEECERLWNEEATSTPAPIVEEEEEDSSPSLLKAEKRTLVPNVEDCRDKWNGDYSIKPCQAWYIYCYDHKGYKMRCSKGFVMSQQYGMCVGEEFCDPKLFEN